MSISKTKLLQKEIRSTKFEIEKFLKELKSNCDKKLYDKIQGNKDAAFDAEDCLMGLIKEHQNEMPGYEEHILYTVFSIMEDTKEMIMNVRQKQKCHAAVAGFETYA